MRAREQKRKRWVSTALAAFAIVAASGAIGCVPPFVKASDTFATAAKGGADALAPSFSTAADLCRTRARLDYTFAREQGTAKELWSKWYSEHQIDGKPGNTWKAHCEMLTTSDALLARGLEAIGAYADALKATAESGNFDGKNIDGLVQDSTKLAQALSSNPTTSKPITDTVAGLSGPIAFIGKSIAQAYSTGKLKESVRAVSPEIEKILAAMRSYNAAVEKGVLRDAEHLLANVLDQADASLRADDEANKRAKPDPLRIFALHETATKYEKELADARAAWAAYAGAIEALSGANKALAQAAEGKMSDEKALELVLGFVNEVVTQIATVKKVAAGGKE